MRQVALTDPAALRVLHLDERTIRFAWTVDGVESTVQFELAEDEGGTLVTLSQ